MLDVSFGGSGGSTVSEKRVPQKALWGAAIYQTPVSKVGIILAHLTSFVRSPTKVGRKVGIYDVFHMHARHMHTCNAADFVAMTYDTYHLHFIETKVSEK